MAKKVSINLSTLILAIVALAAIILVIVGFCIDWVSVTRTVTTSEWLGSESTTTTTAYTLSALGENPADGFGGMNGMAITTLVVALVAFVASVGTKVVSNKYLQFAVLALDLVTIVFAIVTLILTFTYAGVYSSSGNVGILQGESTGTAAIGAWLFAVGGVVGPLVSGFVVLKK